MRKLTGVLTFIVCVPLIGTIFIKPVREPWTQEEEEVSVLDESFQIVVEEEIGKIGRASCRERGCQYV